MVGRAGAQPGGRDGVERRAGYFTSLALAHGTPSQRVRATAVEYSFAMLVGLPGAGRRGERLRSELAAHLSGPLDPYDRGMVQLSHSAGDWFRGSFAGVADGARGAARAFASELGARSWEITNCEMYTLWVELETAPLATVAPRVPEALHASGSRGDRAHRQCFVAGPCSTAWLALDRADELASLLDEVAPPPVRSGCSSSSSSWPGTGSPCTGATSPGLGRASGRRARTSGPAACTASAGSICGSACWRGRRRSTSPTGRSPPSPGACAAGAAQAGPWAAALDAAGAATSALPGALEAAAAAFSAVGCATTAEALLHQLARLRGARRWTFPGADHLADALSVPLSARHFAATRS